MTLRLNTELDQKLDDYARRTGISKQKIIEQSLDDYLERQHVSAAAERAMNRVLTRDKELLERLADA